MEFKFGDIVVYSDLGLKELNPHKYNIARKGVVTGVPMDGLVFVVWKNTKFGYCYSTKFIEKVKI